MTPILPRPEGGSEGDDGGVVPYLSYSQCPSPSTTPVYHRPGTTKIYVIKSSPHLDLGKATYTLTASDHDYSDTDSGLGGGVTPSPNTTLTPSIMSSRSRQVLVTPISGQGSSGGPRQKSLLVPVRSEARRRLNLDTTLSSIRRVSGHKLRQFLSPALLSAEQQQTSLCPLPHPRR